MSNGVIQDVARGDRLNIGTSLIDQTMGGAIINNSLGNGFTPAAIVSKTTLPSFAIVGDSLAYGNFDDADDSGDVGIVARGIGPSFGYVNLACGNDRAIDFLRSHRQRLELGLFASNIIIQYGLNDFASNRTGYQVLADRTAIAALFPSKKINETTITPWTSSTDGFSTTRNQMVMKSEPDRIEANSKIRLGRPGISNYFEIASAVETSPNSGIIRTPNITPDGIHFRQAGYLLAARSIRSSLTERR